VGSLAVDAGDRYSDLDLTFGVAAGVPIVTVLDEWGRMLAEELDAVHLADLGRGPTTYRVFLLPNALQFDLSMTPAAEFRPAGPRFRLLFGETVGDATEPTPPDAGDLFGWGVIYALHARACMERGRVWQGEHYIGAVRDHALSLACLREGQRADQADTTTSPPRRSRDSRTSTSAHSSLTRSRSPSPHPSASSSARGSTRVFRMRTSSRNASLRSAAETAATIIPWG